jgi:hypothetical protein
MLESHAAPSFAIMLFTVIFSTSYSHHVCERVVGGRHGTFGGSMWVVLITLPTVGYGGMLNSSSCAHRIQGAYWRVHCFTLLFARMFDYPDISAMTSCGRVILVLTALAGVISLASLFASLNAFLQLAPYEMRMVELMEVFAKKTERMHLAATVIGRFWKYHKVRFHRPLEKLFDMTD